MCASDSSGSPPDWGFSRLCVAQAPQLLHVGTAHTMSLLKAQAGGYSGWHGAALCI